MTNFTRAIAVLREHEAYAMQNLIAVLHDTDASRERHLEMIDELHSFRAAVRTLQDQGAKSSMVNYERLSDALSQPEQQPS